MGKTQDKVSWYATDDKDVFCQSESWQRCDVDKDVFCQPESGDFIIMKSNNMSYFIITLIFFSPTADCSRRQKPRITFVNVTGGGCSLFPGHVCSLHHNKYCLNRRQETLQIKYDPLEMPEKLQLKTQDILNNFAQIKWGEVIVLVPQLWIQILLCSCLFFYVLFTFFKRITQAIYMCI